MTPVRRVRWVFLLPLLNIDASNSGNGLVKVTSGAAIQLDSLDTTGSGAVAITTTSGNIQIGNGTGRQNAGTGALTVTSAGNVDVTEALTQAGAIANGKRWWNESG